MRLRWAKINEEAYKAVRGLQDVVDKSSLDHKLLELVKIRASQLNGCAYCLDMHTKDARAIGESEQRIYLLPAWREASYYSSKERAALAWCEALTLLPQSGAPDSVYSELENNFSGEEIVELTIAIVTINTWNRLAVGFRTEAGSYVSNRALKLTKK